MLMALPLLPPDFIPIGFLHVNVEIIEFLDNPKVEQLMCYMQNYWIQSTV